MNSGWPLTMATQMQANVRRMIVRTRSKLSRKGRVIEAEGLRRRAAKENSNISAYYQRMVPKKCSLRGTGATRKQLARSSKISWDCHMGDRAGRLTKSPFWLPCHRLTAQPRLSLWPECAWHLTQ